MGILNSIWRSLRNFLPPLVSVAVKGWQLRLMDNKLGQIGKGDILAFVCLRNEAPRMPYFVDYYRRLGVNHFLIIDNGSQDGFAEWARNQPDCSVWHTEASYLAADCGTKWVNHLLRKYGCGHWCLFVDPDEFLVYPKIETRPLRALTGYLDDVEFRSFHAMLVDCYGDKPIEETSYASGDDVFEDCPYFDRDGYFQSPGEGHGTWIQGGPRARAFFADAPKLAPALNKIPLVKWRWYYVYRFSSHDCRPFYLNRVRTRVLEPPTGCLMHFKFTSVFDEKVGEELVRKQHYSGSQEYLRYRDREPAGLYREGLSVRYETPDQLVDLGLMSQGEWP